EHFSWPRFLSIQIWLMVLFLVYVTAHELNTLFGDGELCRLFFRWRSSEAKLEQIRSRPLANAARPHTLNWLPYFMNSHLRHLAFRHVRLLSGGQADIRRPGDDGARAAIPDETLLSDHWHLRVSAHSHVFARPCKSNRARAQTAARHGAEAAARLGEGSLCGTCRQRVSRHGQGEHPRFAK